MENMRNKRFYATINKDDYEKTAWKQQSVVCGVDEVGRGCLAGPLATAAVILPSRSCYPLLKDSKLLSEPQRIKAYNWIIKRCWYATGIVSHQAIDRHNIWQSTLMAMKKAVLNLLSVCPHRPSALLIDAMPLKLLDTDYKNIPVHHFTKGESKSSSIAAASIVAKVTRDRLMRIFDPIFPGYHLGQHKGYSTKKHKAAVVALGPTIIHRTSFLGKTLNQESRENERQESIF
ncbi:ribonuclease HII [Candidatus Dependentiae bacterium]